MRFKFCSDGDCPLWALAALHALSTLPTDVFRTLLQHVVEEQPDDGILDILKDTSLSSREECARAAAAMRWVLRQTWRCECSSAHLTRDLLVLGLPRAHAAAMAEFADSAREGYMANVHTSGFMVNRVSDASISPGPDDTFDTIKLSIFTDHVCTGVQKRRDLLIEKSQAKTLLAELKKAYQKMIELDSK